MCVCIFTQLRLTWVFTIWGDMKVTLTDCISIYFPYKLRRQLLPEVISVSVSVLFSVLFLFIPGVFSCFRNSYCGSTLRSQNVLTL